MAAVIGFMVESVQTKMDLLKKGRSRVIETDHYLILNWSDKTFTLVEELARAMASEGGHACDDDRLSA